MAQVMGRRITEKSLLPILLRSAKDKVPNVRFKVAKAMQKLFPLLEKTVVAKKVIPVIQKLTSDKDADVRYFSEIALKHILSELNIKSKKKK